MKSKKKITVTSDDVPLIYLQSIEKSDVSNEYVQWLNDPIINQYLETRHSTQDLQSVLDYVADIQDNPNEHLFTIRLKKNNKHIGNIKVGNINTHYDIADISLFIGDKTVWGKGIATQAIQLISSFSINKLKLRKLNAGAYKQNIASTKAFLNAGYTRDGVLKDHYIYKNEPCDIVQVCFFRNQVRQLPIIAVYTSPIN